MSEFPISIDMIEPRRSEVRAQEEDPEFKVEDPKEQGHKPPRPRHRSVDHRDARGGYDVIVVGSGYGGSVAACRLAEAGLKVCVLEKGARWEAPNFPRTFWQGVKNMTFNTPWGSLGRQSSLYQVHLDGHCMAVTGAGVGGGSLISAGVWVRAPERTRRDRRWPKEWSGEEWSKHEGSSRRMLGPQTVPVSFPKKRAMDAIIAEEELQDMEDYGPSPRPSLDLVVNFERGTDRGECVACGNCVVGCNYNAKNSTDKNYLESAFQAGACLQTESKVLFIAENPSNLMAAWVESNGSSRLCSCPIYRGIDHECNSDEPECHSDEPEASCSGRSWRVYLDEVSYLTADVVVLAAGVLGTTEILLRSRQRGLRLSERLGMGLSCNGNNIAFASGSPAPLRGQGIDSSKFASTPLSQRPGPVICNSYTSSAGHTIQAATYPGILPYFILRLWTRGWGSAKEWMVWEQLKVWARERWSSFMVLNMMGYDESDGHITLDKGSDRLRFEAPRDPRMLYRISACRKLARRLGARLYVSVFRSTAVHLLGGCGAALDSLHGVADPRGRVFDPEPETDASARIHEGLFVCDGSLLPCPVGLNPTATIVTLAEMVASSVVEYAKQLHTRLDRSDRSL